MHLVQAYVGFDCSKLPLCIFLFNLDFAYLPHPFVKYPPPSKNPPKNCFGTSFWISFYKLCKRILLNISHDRLLLLWLTAIIQSSLQVFSIFAHVSAYSLNFHYPIEKNKKKKRRKKSTNYRFHNIKVPRVTFKTLFLPRNPNLVLVRSTFSWLQIWRAKEGLRLQNLFFLISFFCHTIKNKLL